MRRGIVILMGLMLMQASLSFAQEASPPASSPADRAAAAAEAAKKAATGATDVFHDTFLFNPGELATIQKAAEGTVSGTSMLNAQNQVNIPKKRVISLAGVAYKADNDWILWINGHMVTPDRLLPEIIEIDVRNDMVKMKWFDIGLNGIISITLRPHQTYDIVTGVLLPG